MRHGHFPALLALLLAAACGTTRREQLQRVAKDWCETIRASQVIPVYPLTEDLHPGDVFLVRQPIERQQELYERNGFLPLDYHLARLEPSGYEGFYGRSFPPDGPLPLGWLTDEPAWTAAPAAAFPSYAFEARRDTGLELALPVSGVPVGLGLLGAREATGSVTIADARTLGIDIESLLRDVDAWASEQAGFLAAFGGSGANYLRVVSRVYLAGRMTTSLQDTRRGEADLRAVPETVDTAANLRVVAASSRSITIDETFPRPLVIGYLGFDLPIGEGGALGAPIPTRAVLSRESAGFSDGEAEYLRAMRGMRDAGPDAWARVLRRLGIGAAGPPPDFGTFRELVGRWARDDARVAEATRALLAEGG